MLSFLIEMFLDNLLCFALHFDSSNVFPKPLSSKEETECFMLMEKGDKKAKEKLISHNLRLVAHIIKKYYANAKEQDDLISIGTIGLIKAVSTFDYKKGTRFATYGSRCVENEILMYFRSIKKTSGDVHFNEPIDTDKDGNQLTLMDIIPDDADIADIIDLRINSERLYEHIAKLLDKRETEIISLRYGLFGGIPLTQREVASKLGISRSYVSRIEKKAIATLKSKYNVH